MKYCKKCFRNVREDVSVCPYCGAPGLEDYGSSSSGEDFSCTEPQKLKQDLENEIKSLNLSHDIYDEVNAEVNAEVNDKYETDNKSDDDFFNGFFGDDTSSDKKSIGKSDAYGNSTSQKDNCNKVEYDVYGSKVHNDKDCDNAPNAPTAMSTITKGYYSAGATNLDPNNPKYKMRIEYLNMLKKIDGITPARINELMAKYDELHASNDKATTKRTKKGVTKVYKTTNTNTNTNTNTTSAKTIFNMKGEGENGELSQKQLTVINIVVALFFGFISPMLGIIVYFVLKAVLNKSSKTTQDVSVKISKFVLGVFAILFMFFLMLMMFAVYKTTIGV